MVPMVGFGVFILIAKVTNTVTLNTAKAFTSLTIFTLLGRPMATLIDAAAGLMSAVGCFERIRHYLSADSRTDHRLRIGMLGLQIKPNTLQKFSSLHDQAVELDDLRLVTPREQVSVDVDDCMIVQNLNAGWQTGETPILKGLDFRIRRSSLTIIIGPVGCGKSTLLKALLSETPYNTGSIHATFSEAAYCSQTPWLTNETVCQNILGNSIIDRQWYDTVVRACALEQDLQQFPRGGNSMVGSKGILLSGGQQMRLVGPRHSPALFVSL